MKRLLRYTLFNLAICTCFADNISAPATAESRVYYGMLRMETLSKSGFWELPITTWNRAASIELPESSGKNRCGALGPACRCDVDPSWFMHTGLCKAVVLASEDGWIVDFRSGTATRLKSPDWMMYYHVNRSSDGMGFAKYGEKLCFTSDSVSVWESHEMFHEMLKFDMNGEFLSRVDWMIDEEMWNERPFCDGEDFSERTGLSRRWFELLKPFLLIWNEPDNNYMANAAPSPFEQSKTGIGNKGDSKELFFRLPDIVEDGRGGYKVECLNKGVDFVDMQYATLAPSSGDDALHFYFWRAYGKDDEYEGGCRVLDESKTYSAFAFLTGTGAVLSKGSFYVENRNPGLPVFKSKPQRVSRDSVALMVQNSYMDKCGHYLYVIVSPDFTEDKPVQAICSDAPLYFSPIPLKDGSLVALAPSLWLGKDSLVNRSNFREFDIDIYGSAKVYIIPPTQSSVSEK